MYSAVHIRFVWTCFALMLFTAVHSHAAQRTWDGAGNDWDWRNSANWDGLIRLDPIEQGDTLVFPEGPTKLVSTNDFGAGTNFNSICIPKAASASPAAVPSNESSRPSMKNCRTRRPRLAPSAARIAISLLRPACWANKRPATFAHAINSTKATAANNVNRAGLTFPTTSFMNGLTKTPSPRFSVYSFSSRAPTGR